MKANILYKPKGLKCYIRLLCYTILFINIKQFFLAIFKSKFTKKFSIPFIIIIDKLLDIFNMLIRSIFVGSHQLRTMSYKVL